MALLVVIGLTAAVTISVTKNDGDGEPSPSGETFGLASADDKGPANIITEDPSCAAWTPIIRTLSEEQKNGWERRDRSIPATEWTPEQRRQYEKVADAMRRAADQTVQVAKVTPHRVMRELYEQFIVYARAYADAIPTYTKDDNLLAGVAGGTSNAVTRICTTITYKSAQARGPLVSNAPAPTALAPLIDPRNPQMFMADSDPSCVKLIGLLETFDAESADWQALDSEIPASEWNPEQRSVIDRVIPLMNTLADDIERLGLQSSNPTLQDFAIFAAQYRRAYATALPSYTTADSYLGAASAGITSAIADACRASGS
ncbi:hypothetical protein [Mycolicibacterium gadium]|uniref:hypothetical protein n=1 Tax=Mycolicibacterium gadium TaxID=1794 RepID=UPI001F3E1047|nr:hypothetical protein [Mycolicibacterium gadium]